MFKISHVYYKTERVGIAFSSPFTVVNKGGYLFTFMGKEETATDYTLLLRTPKIVIYNYPNRGALAISPKVSTAMQNFIEEQ